MKKGILLAVVILLSAAGFAQAQEGELSGTVNLTYLSSYIWRGYDWYSNNHSALQLGIDLDLYDTGFGLSILSTRAMKSGNGLLGLPNQGLERLDLTLYYGNSLFEGETYATNYTVGWAYYNFPENSSNVMDLQEFFASLSFPDACPFGVVPSYTIICMWPSESNSWLNATALPGAARGNAGGWIHVVGLGYDLTVPGPVPEIPEQTLHLSADMAYNDGVLGADHDWSHAVLGVSTEFDLVENVAFVPALYYQASMDKSVNMSDEWWVTLGLSYKF